MFDNLTRFLENCFIACIVALNIVVFLAGFYWFMIAGA